MDKERIYNQIISILERLKVPYEEIEHKAVVTTEDSKKQRAEKGWTNGTGSKNILFHAKGKFYLVVTIAEKQIKARKFKKEFGTKNMAARPFMLTTLVRIRPQLIVIFQRVLSG